MSATTHWISLDDVVSRLLPRPGVIQARERFAHRAAALTDIYVAQIQKTIATPTTDERPLRRHLAELELTHHALTAVLNGAWTKDQTQPADPVPRPKDLRS